MDVERLRMVRAVLASAANASAEAPRSPMVLTERLREEREEGGRRSRTWVGGGGM